MELGTALLGSAGIQAGSALLGSLVNKWTNKDDDTEYQRQKEFYQNSLQWRSEDAVKAGFSRQAALGGVATYSPDWQKSSTDFGSAIEKAGSAFGTAMENYTLESMRLKNEKASLELQEKALSLEKQFQQPPANVNTQNVYRGNDFLTNEGWVNMPNEKLLEMLEDTPLSLPLKAEAIETALRKNPEAALRMMHRSSPLLKAFVDEVHQPRKWNLTLRSIPVVNDSFLKASPKLRGKLYDIFYDMGLLDPVLNRMVEKNPNLNKKEMRNKLKSFSTTFKSHDDLKLFNSMLGGGN